MHDYVGQSRWTLEAIGSNAAPVTVPVQGPLSADSASVLLAAALDGAGIAMLPAFAARPHVEAGRLVALLPGWQPPAMGIYGVYATRRQMTPLLRTLLDFLVEWFAAQGFACEEQERGGAAIRTAARATLPEPAEH